MYVSECVCACVCVCIHSFSSLPPSQTTDGLAPPTLRPPGPRPTVIFSGFSFTRNSHTLCCCRTTCFPTPRGSIPLTHSTTCLFLSPRTSSQAMRHTVPRTHTRTHTHRPCCRTTCSPGSLRIHPSHTQHNMSLFVSTAGFTGDAPHCAPHAYTHTHAQTLLQNYMLPHSLRIYISHTAQHVSFVSTDEFTGDAPHCAPHAYTHTHAQTLLQNYMLPHSLRIYISHTAQHVSTVSVSDASFNASGSAHIASVRLHVRKGAATQDASIFDVRQKYLPLFSIRVATQQTFMKRFIFQNISTDIFDARQNPVWPPLEAG